MERAYHILVIEGWADDEPYLMTVDAGACMTVARPDIASRWPKSYLKQCYMLQTVSGEAPTPHFQGSYPDTNPGAAPIENLGFCHQYHMTSSWA
jgi:hypothetical protein